MQTMYKVGDKFVIEIERVSPPVDINREKDALYRVKGFNTLVFDDYGLDKLQKYEDSEYAEGVKEGLNSFDCEVKKAYDKGLQDAWELAKKINDMSISKMQEIFDISEDVIEVQWELFNSLTPQQALAKIEAYEESKAIKVGDVVVCKLDDIQGVVIDIISDEECYTYNENGCVEEHKYNYLKKTGRHIDIEHLLEQIRGNE